ncbi:uncharacterized protein FA14DRAFT_191093 [Meira miltonrushii]|uniref:Restriction of telomere capping protein 4 C-terminal domain-containing protein n=1 Tax=Meira miltonrushii TaxID=1280837 RepID=A0A316V8R3_9BASI|nr:uncharacterized protein FA14DRAFT_191093 [Meira miltonrushii]PWN33997.1 hypothetical protein FA14DRAFT_191093 [Meira miltonrushii]
MAKSQRQNAVAQREEDDSVVDPHSSPKRSLQLKKKDPPAKRPKLTASASSRVQTRRMSSSQDQNNASSSMLLPKLNQHSVENGSTAAYAGSSSQRQSSRNRSKGFTQDFSGKEPPTIKERPKARPRCKPEVENGNVQHSSVQEPQSGTEDLDSEDDEASSSEPDNENDEDYAEGGGKHKKSVKKNGRKKEEEEEQIKGLTLPDRFEISKDVEKLQEWNDLFSQHKSIKYDALDDLQDESFELPETSQGLTTCPFCHSSLPEEPSKKLQDLLNYWLQKIKSQSDAPSSTATAECCQLHEAEKVHIPLGKQKKWPTQHKEKKVVNDFWYDVAICERIIDFVAHPEKSVFYRRQVERREKYGRQANSVQSQMQYFHEEQAGYFGELGAQAIRRTIYHLFEEEWAPKHTLEEFTNRPNNWMKESDFVDKVLFPEVVCALIQKREKKEWGKIISISEAEKIRDESNVYGSIMFPIEKIEKEHEDSLFEKYSSESPVSKYSRKGASEGRPAASSSRSRGKPDNRTSLNSERSRDIAIEVSSGQRIAPNRSTKQRAACTESSSQQIQSPTTSPSRPRPRPSQSRLSQQMPKVDLYGEKIYSSQDQIKSWAVPQLASSPDLQPSSSSTIHFNDKLESSQIASDGSSPLTELEKSQKESSDF